jgi:hypothetical protein
LAYHLAAPERFADAIAAAIRDNNREAAKAD